MVSFLVAVLAVAPTAPVKLAMPALRVVDLPAERSGLYTEQLAGALFARGVRAVTEREISTLLGLERQKALLGCGDGSTQCLVELANALGVDGVVLGDVAKIGNRYQVNLRIIDAKDGKPLAIASFKAADEEGVIDGLVSAAATLADDTNRALGRPVVAPKPSGGVSKKLGIIPVAVAVAAVGAGAALLVVSRGEYAKLDPKGQGTVGLGEAQAIAQNGSTMQTASIALFATGSAFAVAAVGLFVFGSSSETKVGAVVTPGGAAFSIAGVF